MPASAAPLRRAVTLTELLVVIGAIAILSAILLAALAVVKGTGSMTDSMNRLRQIGVWMEVYSKDNRETILPSRFDYTGTPYPGKVRSEANPPQGEVGKGSWTDILWTINELGPVRKDAGVVAYRYQYDSPDRSLYEEVMGTDWNGNPLRAGAANTRNTPGSDTSNEAKPFDPDPSKGAYEAGLAGFFAANDFFDPAGGTWWVTGQIHAPGRSMYLIDSYAGETISPIPEAYEAAGGVSPQPPQVDFRYGGGEFCLTLLLDYHVEPISRFDTLVELEGDPANPEDHGRGIRVRSLDRRSVTP